VKLNILENNPYKSIILVSVYNRCMNMHSSTVTFAEDSFIKLIRGHLSLNQISGVIFESRELAATSNNVYLIRTGFFGFFGFDCFQNYIVFSFQCISQQIWN